MPRPFLSQTQRWILGGIVAVCLLLGALAAIVPGLRDDAEEATTTTTSLPTSSTSSSTTSEPSPTSTTTFESPVDPLTVAFPAPTSSQRFEDPVAVAAAYATTVLGFTTPSVGAFDALTDDWGKVVVGADATGRTATRIEVQREADQTWYVLGSETDEIEVTTPARGASLTSPFQTMGRALAFEGVVEVVVLGQEGLEPLGNGTVLGSGVPPAGPFSGAIHFSPPAEATAGILIYRTLSARDGSVDRATSFPVRLVPSATVGGSGD